MAQEFVGSNNIQLLVPCGMFGTRQKGGHDAASPRYIFSKLDTLTRLLFRPEDDAVLEYVEDDGMKVEPRWFAPILPMVLMNGCEGIGTGWSTSIANHNPLDLERNVRRMLDGLEPEPMQPWYAGFTGRIEPDSKSGARGVTNYRVWGSIHKVDDETLHINELPVGMWTEGHKQLLERMESEKQIKSFREHHTEDTVSFMITLDAKQMAVVESKGLVQAFDLESSIAMTNLVVLDAVHHKPQRCNSAVEIIKAYFPVRLALYEKRKAAQLAKLADDMKWLSEKARFVQAVADERLMVRKVKQSDLARRLFADGYTPRRSKGKQATIAGADDAESEPQEGQAADTMDLSSDEKDDPESQSQDRAGAFVPQPRDYAHLLNLPLASLSHEHLARIQRDLQSMQAQHDKLARTECKDLWRAELDAFSQAYRQRLQQKADGQRPQNANQTRTKRTPQKRRPSRARSKAKSSSKQSSDKPTSTAAKPMVQTAMTEQEKQAWSWLDDALDKAKTGKSKKIKRSRPLSSEKRDTGQKKVKKTVEELRKECAALVNQCVALADKKSA